MELSSCALWMRKITTVREKRKKEGNLYGRFPYWSCWGIKVIILLQ
jgi:hypothetical protein